MIAAVGSRLVILLFGTLYPAYASYKAVRNKDVKAYVQWMMYWIVFALFTCAETFSDVFLSFWVPFYYELKVVIVLWLLSPATKGSSLLYRKFVHPTLTEREKEIDEYLAKMRERSYSTMLELGSKGINYALQTAIKSGGGIVNHLRRSYSLSDLTDQTDGNMVTGELPPRQHRPPRGVPVLDDSDDTDDLGSVSHRGYSPRRSASGSGRMEMYFPAVDVDVRQRDVRQAPAGKSVTALSQEMADMGNEVIARLVYAPVKQAICDIIAASTFLLIENKLEINDYVQINVYFSCEPTDQVDNGDSGMEVDGGEPLVRTASLSSTRSSGRLRRPTNPGGVTTPSGRKTVVASVPEGTDAESTKLPPSPPNLEISDSQTSESEISISEVSTVVDNLEPQNDVIKTEPDLESNIQVAEILDTDVVSERSENLKKTLAESIYPAIVPPMIECVDNFEEIINDTLDNIEFDEVLEEKLQEIKAENENLLIEMEEKESEIEFMEALSEKLKELQYDNLDRRSEELEDKNDFVEASDDGLGVLDHSDLRHEEKSEEFVDATSQNSNKTSDKNSSNVLVTVEVQSENPGSMLVRLSMESLPTSSKQAQVFDNSIPTVIETYENQSLKTSNDSLASCSLPGTPSVSRSNSRMSDGRAGKYNKLPAPLRPESPIVEEENPVKARLVLKPGVLRQLPETLGDSSEVFLPTSSKDKKKRKPKPSSLFPFWGSKANEQAKDGKAGEKKTTNL